MKLVPVNDSEARKDHDSLHWSIGESVNIIVRDGGSTFLIIDKDSISRAKPDPLVICLLKYPQNVTKVSEIDTKGVDFDIWVTEL